MVIDGIISNRIAQIPAKTLVAEISLDVVIHILAHLSNLKKKLTNTLEKHLPHLDSIISAVFTVCCRKVQKSGLYVANNEI